jgi:hypothetical protein
MVIHSRHWFAGAGRESRRLRRARDTAGASDNHDYGNQYGGQNKDGFRDY